jgi:hypothetical protein
MITINKNLFTLLIMLALTPIVYAQPSGKAKPGTVYGEKTNNALVADASSLASVLNRNDTVDIKVKTTVLEVCSKKGCWLTFKVDDKNEAFVKMKDYGFFVPVDLIGKTVVIEGKAFAKTTSVEDLKHYAEDAKKPKAEIDAITEPKKEIRVVAKGILVLEGI